MATIIETGIRLTRPQSNAFASNRVSSRLFSARAASSLSRPVLPCVSSRNQPMRPLSPRSYTISNRFARDRLIRSLPISKLDARGFRGFATSASNTTSTSSGPHEESSNSGPDPSPPSPGLTGKLKDLMKKYGRHALGVYLLLSGVDLTITFVLVHLAGADKIEWVKDYVVASWRSVRYGREAAEEMQRVEDEEQRAKDLAEQAEQGTQPQQPGQKKRKNANAMLWAEFALAYGIHKTLLLPVRVGATAAVTPKLIVSFHVQGGVARAASHASGKVKQASAQAQDKVKEASGRVKDLAKRTKE
ncbi:hypothetical protein QFC19_008583 [Naganishia cerealis]|uniref:Uncharacterized protein n=1 Tax=Naganishia cerealis TaxID=610337 RepID=A0ACC2V0J6_9TREE|nr:hypothetical protein QFC19_008583 [Naganishia cerealis]